MKRVHVFQQSEIISKTNDNTFSNSEIYYIHNYNPLELKSLIGTLEAFSTFFYKSKLGFSIRNYSAFIPSYVVIRKRFSC